MFDFDRLSVTQDTLKTLVRYKSSTMKFISLLTSYRFNTHIFPVQFFISVFITKKIKAIILEQQMKLQTSTQHWLHSDNVTLNGKALPKIPFENFLYSRMFRSNNQIKLLIARIFFDSC